MAPHLVARRMRKDGLDLKRNRVRVLRGRSRGGVKLRS